MIISGIISNATHMALSDFAAKYLFEPLGIKKYQWTKDKKGHAMTAGSFYISPTDYIKIGELVLQKGSWNNRRIVSEAWLNRATERITQIENFSNVAISKTKSAIPQPTWYGYYWYNEEINTGKLKYNIVFASGNGGQYIMIIKELRLVILFNGNSYDSWKSKLQFELLAKYILPYFAHF
jgi:CubicO group peptidase (beta-lactamase class C family)